MLAFGTSGLRGLVTDMTDIECYINTLGFLSYLESINHLVADTVYIAGDLRDSTPRIMNAVSAAIRDHGQTVINCGFIPTPAVAYYAGLQNSPCIMVTGSHIPDDRNGIKFYKADGEILKNDEESIKDHVARVRERIYDESDGQFAQDGSLIGGYELPTVALDASTAYKERYTSVFGTIFSGKDIVVYQHSAVGRDMLVDILTDLGANVITVGRSAKFVPIDTENVTPEDMAYFRDVAAEHAGCFAILSTDGDSDRPFVIDEKGIFHRGDDLGAMVSVGLGADFAAYPISSSDAVDTYLENNKIAYEHTKIGSPYVIVAMQEAADKGYRAVVGWEVNGGFLIGEDVVIGEKTLSKLPTRDAFFPMIYALKIAAENDKSVSAVFDTLPKRYTQAGMIDNFPSEVYQKIKERFADDTSENRQFLSSFFNEHAGYGKLLKINALDGIRMYFDNGDIAHIRGSGNAPQLRFYSVADSQERADEMVRAAIDGSEGILRQLERGLF